MDEVSCRLFEANFHRLPAIGKSVEDLCVGMTVTVDRLADPKASLTWVEFIALVDRLEQVVGPGEEFKHYLRGEFDDVVSNTVGRLYGSAVSPAQLYRMILWTQRTFAPGVKSKINRVGPDQLRIRLIVPEGVPWPESLWTVGQCTFEAVPRVLGLPDSRVVVSGSSNDRTYDIMLPPTMGFGQRVRRAWHSFFNRPGPTDFILAQQEELDRGFERLQAEMKRREQAESQLAQSQKLELLGQLAGGIAHDFNNLLTVVLGNLELLASEEELSKMGQQCLTDSVRAVEGGSSLTSSLLSLSRKHQPKAQIVDLCEALSDMTPLMARTLPPSIDVIRLLGEAPAYVRLDLGQLQNALLNLVLNADHAMKGHGIITIRIAVNDSMVTLSVEDNGPGMTDEVRKRATEPFFTTKSHGTGTGLGLAIVNRFVTEAEGALEFASGVDGGTLVSMRFPLVEGVEYSATNRAPGTQAGRGERIMLLDDNPEVLRTTGNILRLLGYSVTAVGEGAAALDQLDDTYRLFLSDVVLTGERSGVDITSTAKSRFPDLAVLLITGYSPEGVDVPGEQAVLAKPYSVDSLALAVQKELAGR